MRLVKMNRTQLFAHVRRNGDTIVYLIGSKMYFRQENAYKTTLTTNSNNQIVTKQDGKDFVVMYNAWSYYNTDYDHGYYAHYYVACEYEYEIQQLTAQEWECVSTEVNPDLARQCLVAYRVNQPQYQHRIIRKLVSALEY